MADGAVGQLVQGMRHLRAAAIAVEECGSWHATQSAPA